MHPIIEKARKTGSNAKIPWALFAVFAFWSSFNSRQMAQDFMKDQKVGIINSGTQYIAFVKPAQLENRFHEMLAKEAAEIIFNRNPQGYEKEEMMERVFNTPCQKQLHAALNDPVESRAFVVQKMTQHYDHLQTSHEWIDSEHVKVVEDGTITRNSIIDGKPETSTFLVRISMQFVKNHDFDGKFLLVVEHFTPTVTLPPSQKS